MVIITHNMEINNIPAIQIPVLILVSTHKPRDCSISSRVSFRWIFRGGQVSFSVTIAAEDSRKNAPMRIQSVKFHQIEKYK